MFCCYLVALNVCVPAVIFKLNKLTELGADGKVYDSFIHT